MKTDRQTFSTENIDYKNRTEHQRPSWDEDFLGIADAVSKRSHDPQTQVGAVITDENNRIIATGYNGFPPGCDDTSLPNLRPDKYPFMVHAEINAISSSRQDIRGATLYVTWSPCRECAKAIITAGVKKVVYKTSYQNDDYQFVKDFFTQCGIEVVKLDC